MGKVSWDPKNKTIVGLLVLDPLWARRSRIRLRINGEAGRKDEEKKEVNEE
jgi:hypothetical protein